MKPKNGESGQTLVEFALVVPLLLLLIFGMIEFGRVFHATHVITSAAREGARAVAVHNDSQVDARVKDAISSLVESTNVYPKTKSVYDSGDPPAGQVYYTYSIIDHTVVEKSVVFEVKGAVQIFVPVISSIYTIISENPKIIKSQAQMRIE